LQKIISSEEKKQRKQRYTPLIPYWHCVQYGFDDFLDNTFRLLFITNFAEVRMVKNVYAVVVAILRMQKAINVY